MCLNKEGALTTLFRIRRSVSVQIAESVNKIGTTILSGSDQLFNAGLVRHHTVFPDLNQALPPSSMDF